MKLPVWMEEAYEWVGEKEVPGPGVNAWIKAMWLGLKGGAWFWKAYGEDDSKLPWCGAFVAYCLAQSGLMYPANYARAKAWASWGAPISRPMVGAVAIFHRSGGGHVGFVTGIRWNGDLVILGGNQNDGVTVADYPRRDLVALRWPGVEIGEARPAPEVSGLGKYATSV
jgi:uncharacterized protein (TIGR02594 family)